MCQKRFGSHFFFLTIIILLFGFTDSVGQNVNVTDATKKAHAFSKSRKTVKDSTKKESNGHIIPVPFIITDKNLGYGGILALGYIHSNKKTVNKNTPPTITGVAGGGTSAKSWALALVHSQSFKNDDIRYFGGILYANVNLNFYQLGNIDLSNNPFGVNLKGWGTFHSASFRVKKSNFFIGPQYGFLSINSSLNLEDQDHPYLDSLINTIDVHSNLSALGVIADYDNRDNTISPKKGFKTGFTLSYNATWLGASQNFMLSDVYFYGYVPFTKWLFSIYHVDAQFSAGDVPFYMKPFVALRGAPAMRYQGNEAMLAEVQLRGYFYKNLALVAYTGAGKAFNSFSEFAEGQWVFNYGTGFRWELKKVFGVRVGIDVAWANDDFGWYIVIGTGL